MEKRCESVQRGTERYRAGRATASSRVGAPAAVPRTGCDRCCPLGRNSTRTVSASPPSQPVSYPIHARQRAESRSSPSSTSQSAIEASKAGWASNGALASAWSLHTSSDPRSTGASSPARPRSSAPCSLSTASGSRRGTPRAACASPAGAARSVRAGLARSRGRGRGAAARGGGPVGSRRRPERRALPVQDVPGSRSAAGRLTPATFRPRSWITGRRGPSRSAGQGSRRPPPAARRGRTRW